MFDKAELLECIRKLVEVDQEWVPYSQDASLYIRPTFIGIEVSRAEIYEISPSSLELLLVLTSHLPPLSCSRPSVCHGQVKL